MQFVGGPFDGETRILPQGTDTWYVQMAPPIEAEGGDAPMELRKPLRYRRMGEIVSGEKTTYIFVFDGYQSR